MTHIAMAERDSSGPPPKKSRLDLKDKTFYENLQKFESEKKSVCFAYSDFFTVKTTGLLPRQIKQCNADTNLPFSRAHCILKQCSKDEIDEIYQFGSIFRRGVKILNNLLKSEEYIPEDEETKVLLQPFLEFIFDEDSHLALRKLIDEAENEAQLMMTLVVHFFCKLSVSRGCKMNKYASGNTFLEGTHFKKFEDVAIFDDTSIGHKDVWHGNLDIVLESSQIGVHCTPLDGNEDSPGGRTAVEVKFKELDSMSVMDQALAQTITFSFLQHHLHPAMKHFLIPSILASPKEVQFLFYDSENDILLQSKPFPFFFGETLKTLNYRAVIATWLVLNYKYLCTGPIPSMLGAPKADFPKFAGDSLEIYKTKLRSRNVTEKSSVKDETWHEIETGCDCTFQWYEKDDSVEAFEMCPTKK